MKKLFAPAVIGLLLLSTASRADDQTKDEDRLANCGTVLSEIMNIPDNIPQDVLDKADCVVVCPNDVFEIGRMNGQPVDRAQDQASEA